MGSFRRRDRDLERALRAGAPAPRSAFLDELVKLVETRPARSVSRVRVSFAVALAALFAASFAALGAPSYVKAAASAVAQTAKSTIAATTQNGGGNNGNNGNDGNNGNNGGGNDHCSDGHGNDCGGGAGAAQYGGKTPICHRTHSEKNPFVMIVVSDNAIPAHQAHGDIIPAPADGCPGKQKGKKDKETKPTIESLASVLRVGDDATFEVSVDATDGSTPEGDVICFDNAVEFDSDTASGGEATCTETLDTPGQHAITAVYSTGDADEWDSSESDPVTVTVSAARATVVLVTSVTPSGPGATVTFTATVSGVTGSVPTGSVQFLDATAPIGAPVPLSATGVATLTTAALRAGAHVITAAYTGDSTYGIASGTVAQDVLASTPTTAAYTGPSAALYGQPLALSASVTGAPAGASVTIAYPGGSTSLSLGTTVSITPAWIGPGVVKVTYAGDSTHLASTSTTTVVSNVPTTVTLSSSLDPAPIDAPVKLSATIATPSGASLPAGATVTFFDGATSLGTATVVAGQASLTVGTLAAGTHSLSVSFAGNPGLYVMPGSSSLSETILGLPTAVSYTGPPNTYGGVPITLTAATTGIPDGAAITFTLPGGAAVSGTVRGNSASATATVNWTPVSGSTVGVRYAGDARRAPASATGTLVLFTRAVGIGVSSSANPVPSGQSLTYSVTVSSNEVANPQGSVTVFDNGSVLGTRTLSASGAASVTVTAGTIGTHAITASYASSDTGKWVNATSGALTETIGKPAVTVTLATSAATVEPGAQVTFSVTVLPVVRVTAVPTGTVQFKEGSTVLGTATISSSGTASFSTNDLPLGAHTITAVYAGDAVYDGNASGALTQTVNPTATSTTLSASPSAPDDNDWVTFSVAVTAKGAALGGGSVAFVLDGTTLGSDDVGDDGRVDYRVHKLDAGTHTVSAQYSPPSGNYAASGASLTLTVSSK